MSTYVRTDRSSRPAASISFLVWLIAAALLPGATADALTIDVNCDGDKVGEIEVSLDGSGITGGFRSVWGTPPSLAAAAAKCDEHHFNWYQIASGDHPLIPAGQTIVDPQPGGQGGQWADDIPWYLDEGDDPPSGTSGWADGYHLDDNLHDTNPADGTDETLGYFDYPGAGEEATVTFKTWLVSLNEDGSFHAWHEGFTWTWSESDTGVRTTSDLAELDASPTDAEYGDIIGGFDSAIPEPSTLALLVVGGLMGSVKRRRAA